MSQRTEGEPAFVLHRRPYRESSLLLDVLTLNHGRLGLVARSASRPNNPWKAQLQPFQPLLLAWTGRADLKTLTDAELRTAPPLVGQSRLYCGLYLNELLQRLLPAQEPVPELFAAYLDTLAILRTADNLEQGLRRFEYSLVAALGYGFRWGWATDIDAPVESGGLYAYDPQQGITAAAGPGCLMRNIPGQSLLALDRGDAPAPAEARLAKQIMRRLIDFLLQGRPLQSRRLFRDASNANVRPKNQPS